MDLSNNFITDISSNNLSVLDDFTMQCLMNKSQYNKYLEKSNPIKYKKMSDFQNKKIYYKNGIIEIVKDYLTNMRFSVSNELDESFESFVKSCIKHFEMKEFEQNIEHKSKYSFDDNDDVIFEKINNTVSNNSFWGPTVKKI